MNGWRTIAGLVLVDQSYRTDFGPRCPYPFGPDTCCMLSRSYQPTGILRLGYYHTTLTEEGFEPATSLKMSISRTDTHEACSTAELPGRKAPTGLG